MTIPHLMNCDHSEEWCLACVKKMQAELEQVTAERDELREALERIEKWFGEFPETNKFWPDGSPMSYGTCYGSNGERDYMRELARIALAKGGA